jgi:uncharacterized membrane protein
MKRNAAQSLFKALGTACPIAVCLLLSVAARAALSAELIMIGQVPTPEQDPYHLSYEISNATAVSGDGTTVIGGLSYGPFRGEYRWTRESGFTEIGDLWESVDGGGFSTAKAVSDDGRMVVGSSFVDDPGEPLYLPNSTFALPGRAGFRWTQEHGPVGLDDLAGGLYRGSALGISDDGTVIVGTSASASNYYTAVRWLAGHDVEELPGGQGLAATGVSADGRTIVGSSQFADKSLVWDEENGTTRIGDLLDENKWRAEALAISADGTTVVGMAAASHGGEAFRWTRETGTVGLGLLSSDMWHSRALDVNGDGSVIVGTSDSDDPLCRAFIWSGQYGMRSVRDVLAELHVDTSRWKFDEAVGVSNDGQVIVGNGRYQDNCAAWLVDLSAVPEPSGALLAVLCPVAYWILVRPRRTMCRRAFTRSGP